MSLVADTPAPELDGSRSLETHVVDLWWARLDLDRYELRRLEDLISPEERERARRAPMARRAARLLAASGIRRAVLARYLRCDPRQLSFTKGPKGKPELRSSSAQEPQLRFNTSHSGGFALYAVASSGRIGVDLEQIRPEFADPQTTASFLAPSELDELRHLPAERRLDGFFFCWTRKEAYLKATGEGLSVPVDSFSVGVRPGEEAKLTEHRDRSELGRWTLRSFSPAPGFIASVAIGAADVELRHFDWNPDPDTKPRMVDR